MPNNSKRKALDRLKALGRVLPGTLAGVGVGMSGLVPGGPLVVAPAAAAAGVGAGGLSGLLAGLHRRHKTRKAYKQLGADTDAGLQLLSQLSGISKQASFQDLGAQLAAAAKSAKAAPASAAAAGGLAAGSIPGSILGGLLGAKAYSKIRDKVAPKDYELAMGLRALADSVKKSPIPQLAGLLRMAHPKLVGSSSELRG